MMKIEYKPTHDCCNHFKTKLFTVGYQANLRTGKPSKFKVYICDNCGECHDHYGGVKGFFSELYFRFISQGCVYVEEDVEDGESD